ncbi:MAG: hypothetical protein WC787_00585 [Patescibacteria group bacterium]|jgi:hypothetical protein
MGKIIKSFVILALMGGCCYGACILAKKVWDYGLAQAGRDLNASMDRLNATFER